MECVLVLLKLNSGSGCLTKSDSKVKINVLVDLSACGGTFFMHIYN